MAEWFEKLDGNLWLRPDETGEDEARFLKKALHLRKGQAVLDAPCGTGRIAFNLARWGFQIAGVELREAFVARGRKRFKEAGLLFCVIQWYTAQADFAHLDTRVAQLPVLHRRPPGIRLWKPTTSVNAILIPELGLCGWNDGDPTLRDARCPHLLRAS